MSRPSLAAVALIVVSTIALGVAGSGHLALAFGAGIGLGALSAAGVIALGQTVARSGAGPKSRLPVSLVLLKLPLVAGALYLLVGVARLNPMALLGGYSLALAVGIGMYVRRDRR